MATLVLSVIGDDQVGLVDALARVVTDGGGNWQKGHLTQLAGKFAGIVLVTVPDAAEADLLDALGRLDAASPLHIAIERAEPAEVPEADMLRFELELVGQDRAGIVHEISEALAGHGVNIADLETSTTSAPMSGDLLFTALAVLDVPRSVSLDDLRSGLEALANELMVDIELSS